MQSFYRRLDWLDVGDASDYLSILTELSITERGLLQLVEEGKCRTYLSCSHRNGWIATPVVEDGRLARIDEIEVIGDGHCQVLLASGSSNLFPVLGRVYRSDTGHFIDEQRWWLRAPRDFKFKPTDIEALADWIAESTERDQAIKLDDLPDADSSSELKDLRQQLAANHSIGLTFPYATKALEAMHAVALKHWAEYSPDKRQPSQVEIQLELCELLGLSLTKNGDPPRKAVELATAIKPDTRPLPDKSR